MNEPAWTARLRAAYSGLSDPVDLLWWCEHPGEPGPTGATDPRIEVDALRRWVYSREAADDPRRPSAEHRLDAFIQRDRTDAAALESAIRRADEPPEFDLGPFSPNDSPSVRTERRDVIPVVLAAIAAGTAVAVVLLGSGVPHADALSVFDETQMRKDEIPYLADATTVAPLELDTARAVGSSYGWELWTVRSAVEEVCLYGVQEALSELACVDEAEFAASGLTIVLPNPFTGAEEFDPGARTGPTALRFGPDSTRLEWVDPP